MTERNDKVRRWMKRLGLSCGAVVLSLACVGAAAAEEVHGFVVYGDYPMPGATVTLVQGGKKFVSVTDSQGLYSFSDLTDGAASIDVEMTGFESLKQDITVGANMPSIKWPMTLLSLEAMRAALKPVPSPPFTETVVRSEPVKTGVAPKPAAGQPAPPPPSEDTAQRAQDGLLVNGSVNNAATSQYTLAARFGNTASGKSLYNYSLRLQVENSALDAQSYSLTGFQSTKPQTSQITGGFAVQGPLSIPHVLRKGPDVYFGYQRVQNSVAVTTPGLVPDAYERGCTMPAQPGCVGTTADFSHEATPVVVINPGTGQPYANGLVPISQQAQALLKLYPLPNFAGNSQYNYQIPLVTDTHQDDYTGYASKTIGRRNQLTGQFNAESIRTSTANLFGFTDTTSTLGMDAKVNWSHTFNSSWRANVIYEYTRESTRVSPYWAHRSDVASAAGIAGTDYLQAAYWGPPSLSFTGGLSGLSDGQNTFTRNQTQEISYVAHWNRLQHNVTGGVEFHRQQYNYLQQANPRGTFNFTGATTGSDVADFLVGTANTASIAFGNADKYLRQNVLALYLNDDWRLMPTLTLNVGVRYEYGAPVTELKDRMANIDVSPDYTAASTVVASSPKGSTTGQSFPNSLTRPDRTGIEPRIGVSWRPIAGSSLLLSAGYGVTYDTSVYKGIALNMAQQDPFSNSKVLQNGSNCALTLGTGLQCPGNPVGDTFGVDPNLRVGYLQTWSFKLQRDLPFALQLNASYLGNKGTHGAQLFLPNTNAPGAVVTCPLCPVGFEYLTSGGNSNREAGQLQLRRRLKSGFTASVMYTYSKSIDDDSALGGQGAATLGSATIAQDWRHLRAERGLSTFDQRNLLNVTVQYTTGMGKGGGSLMTGWRGKVYKEWTVQTQITAGSGLPETPLVDAIAVAGYASFVRPDVTGVPLYGATTGGGFLNRAAYRQPVSGQWGDARRDSITGPSQLTLNAALLRTFRLTQRFNLDAQIAAANALNHVNFSSYYTNINSQQFGLPTAAQTMRTVQTSLRLRF